MDSLFHDCSRADQSFLGGGHVLEEEPSKIEIREEVYKGKTYASMVLVLLLALGFAAYAFWHTL